MIRYPRVEAVRRSRAGELTKGDYAVSSTTTGLIDFIDALAARGVEGAAGYSLRHSMPLQLGGTSGHALLSVAGADAGDSWSAYRLDARWFQLPGRNELLRTRAEAEHVTPNLVRFTLDATAGGARCAQGRSYYVRIRNGVNLATGAAIGATNKPVAQPGSERIHYSPFLVKLLMNPVSGGHEPLGRRLHPLGSIPFGAAAFQAMRVYPGSTLVSATLRYISAMPQDEGFFTQATTSPGGVAHIALIDHAGVPWATCSCVFEPG